MSGIGSTISQAVSGAPQSIASGEGIFGSLAHAVSPVTGDIYDGLTKVAGLALMSGLGGSGGGGGLLGGGGLGGGTASGASDMTGMQPAGSLSGIPYYSADQYANYGPNAPGNSAFFAPPVPPPPASLSPSGGGMAGGPPLGNLNPLGGGALQQAMNAPTAGSIGQMIAAPNASTGGGDPSTPWYANPAYWQGAGSVGSAYLKFLTDQKQPEFAKPFGSTVTPQTLNPLAGVRSSPIQPPQLVV